MTVINSVAGRSTDPRTVASVVATNAVATFTFPSGTITVNDVGRTITHTGFPAGTTIISVQSATGATASAAATSGATATATIGQGTGLASGFLGWSPESVAESLLYTLAGGAGATAPHVLPNSTTEKFYRTR